MPHFRFLNSRSLSFALVVNLMLGIPPIVRGTDAEARTAAENQASLSQQNGWKITGRRVGLLKPGKTVEYMVSVERGKTYVFSVGGCRDAYDVDLVVRDGDVAVAFDATTLPTARTEIVATEAKNYKVVIKMKDCTPNGAHFCLLFGERVTSPAPK